jgi:large subunit ribosomal protein L13
MYKTPILKHTEIEREWYIVDVADSILGRSATKIAELLSGKGKVKRNANIDAGDYVIVINASRVALSRNKKDSKEYFRHSGFPGGAKVRKFKELIITNPDYVIRHAVKNMLPNNKLRASMLKRLFVYADENHKYSAQKPKKINL